MKLFIKLLYILLLFVFISCSAPKARPIVDYTNLSLFIDKHKDSHRNKVDSRDNQSLKAAQQRVLTSEVNRNRKLQETLNKRFTETSIILTQIPKLPRLLELGNSIKSGQLELFDIASNDPKLLPFIIEIEANTLRRINSLIDFFNNTVLIGTSLNQVSLGKRLKTIDAILFELTKIKVAQSVAIRKLKFISQRNYFNNLISLNNRLSNQLNNGINRQEIVDNALPKFNTGLENENLD